MSTFHKLSIQNIIRETALAVSIVFDVPQELQSNFSFKAGQYITLKATIDGNEVRRAYSLCSSPSSRELKVTVKEVENGTFSVFANNHLQIGDTLEVSIPEGKFVLEPKNKQNYIAFASGSGITPVLSMIKATLSENDSATFTLIYGNRSVADTIFHKELELLATEFSTRFELQFVYSRESVKHSLSGRINKELTSNLIKNTYANTKFDAAFLCGPEEMITTVSSKLEELGINKNSIFYELFTTSSSEENTEKIKDGTSNVTVLIDDEEIEFTMKQTDNLLAASLRNQVDAPYSCQGGVCSSCLAKITEGKAVMTKNSILSEEEVEEGFVLTCQAHPTTPKIHVDFDDV